MTEQELKNLKKDLLRKKRIASEWAAKLHDLAEEGLPADYKALPVLAEATFNACREWEDAQDLLLSQQAD